jgi:urease accessory protein
MVSGRVRWVGLLAVLMVWAVPAAARPSLGAGSFGSGYQAVLVSLVHLLGLLGIGLFAGIQGGRVVWQAPAAALTAVVAAGLVAQAGIGLPYAGQGLAISLMVIGGLVGLATPMPEVLAVIGAIAAAVFHGHALGYGARGGGLPALYYWCGAVSAAAVALAAGVGLTQAFPVRIVPILGGLIAVTGLLVLVGVW